MIIGDRLREIRIQRDLTQGDVEQRTGLLSCYISRVENGHTIPSVETIEKFARALEIPLYQVFYDGETPLNLTHLPGRKTSDDLAWGSKGKDARFLNKLRGLLSKTGQEDRRLLMQFVEGLAKLRSIRENANDARIVNESTRPKRDVNMPEKHR